MFHTQPGQYSRLLKRYVVQQISALTSPSSAERESEPEAEKIDLGSRAFSEVADWSPQANRKPSSFLPRQSFLTALGIRQLYTALRQNDRAEWVECLLTNSRFLHSVTSAFSGALRDARTLARVSACGARPVPRAYLAVRAYLSAVQDKFRQDTFVIFIDAIQQHATFDMDELWVFKPLLQLRLMQRLLQIGSELSHTADRDRLQKLPAELVAILESVRELDHTNWDRIFAKLSIVEQILRTDPIYAQMDPASRDSYRHAVGEMAGRSRKSEAEIAQQAIDLARQAPFESAGYSNHVGFFLIDEGREQLRKLVGHRSSFLGWLR